MSRLLLLQLVMEHLDIGNVEQERSLEEARSFSACYNSYRWDQKDCFEQALRRDGDAQLLDGQVERHAYVFLDESCMDHIRSAVAADAASVDHWGAA